MAGLLDDIIGVQVGIATSHSRGGIEVIPSAIVQEQGRNVE